MSEITYQFWWVIFTYQLTHQILFHICKKIKKRKNKEIWKNII